MVRGVLLLEEELRITDPKSPLLYPLSENVADSGPCADCPLRLQKDTHDSM